MDHLVEVRAKPAVGRRLRPLYVASFLQNLALWVPIEKLFMSSIGFDATSVGVMAAVYAIVVPLCEVPSGVLADRWSRRGVLVIGSIAGLLSVVVGGLSQNVATYMVAASLLGVFFAMQSGTLESIVYDTLLEETGGSDEFERTIGRVRLVESVALVSSALVGGAIAQVAPLRLTYFLTVPLAIGACVALLTVREPRLHQVEEAEPLRRQLTTTYRAILRRGTLRLVVALTIASSLLIQVTIEFGPLWLVALAVPAFLYGPHWAGLTAALGLGGVLGARGWLTRRWVAAVVAAGIVGCCLVLATVESAGPVVGAQVLLVLLCVAVSIPLTRRLHDSVPSTIRAGVASGVGTLTWLAFVPFALMIGFVSGKAGVFDAGWVLVALAVLAGLLIFFGLPRPAAPRVPTFAADRFLPPDDPDWPGHWAIPPVAWPEEELRSEHLRADVRAAITEMAPELRQVIVLRDVRGSTAEEVQRELALSPEDERALLHQARGIVRARLERRFRNGGHHDR